jgi:hypothetical protein
MSRDIGKAMAEYRTWEQELRAAEAAYDAEFEQTRMVDEEYERMREAASEKLIAAESLIAALLEGVGSLRRAVDDMHTFAKNCANDHGVIEDYHTYDSGMTDYREDVAFAAEQLIQDVFPAVVEK